MIELQVGGQSYTTWTSVEVERSLDTISGIFKFECVASESDTFPIPRGQSCTVVINGKTVITGYVDKIEVNYSASEHKICIEGRDKTCDIVDSHIDEKLEFKAPITLEEVIKKTLDDIGASDIEVKNTVDGLKPFQKEELVSGKIGEKAFEFMDKYAAKRQVVLTTDGLGNVVIARASTELTSIVLKNAIDDPFNTIKEATVTYDDSERFNSYVFVTQANHSAEPKMTDAPKKSTNRRYKYVDNDIRASRKFVAICEGNSKEKPIEDRAKWEANIRKAKSIKYSCTHVAHSPDSWDGEPYQPNTLVTVTDDFADVNTELLIIKTIHRLSMSDGSTTEMELLTREAFLLLLEEKQEKSSKGKHKKKGADNTAFSKFDNSTSRYFEKYPTKGS